MLPEVEQLDAMDESMWGLLQRNLSGITELEADWRPHPDANPVRWMLGHLAWFEEWAHDALARDGLYRTARDPSAYLDGTVPELLSRFTAARNRYRARIAALDATSLSRRLSYFGKYDVSEIELLRVHALHLAGHRFQIRYVRGTYSRAHGTRKADFDPW
ncbi:MAG: DinB family protein [Gemmatimonadaceae bacterium]